MDFECYKERDQQSGHITGNVSISSWAIQGKIITFAIVGGNKQQVYYGGIC